LVRELKIVAIRIAKGFLSSSAIWVTTGVSHFRNCPLRIRMTGAMSSSFIEG